MIKQSKGITLIALVIIIIIILILAGISIQALTNTGLFEQASRAKNETQRAQVTEWLNLKLMEEQMNNPTGSAEEIIEATRAASDGNTELSKMGKVVVVDANTSTIEDGEQVDVYFYVQVDEDVYKVEMAGAQFIGEAGKFPPIIKLESITGTTSSITVQVSTKRNEGGKIEFYIKKEGETEYTSKYTAEGEEAKGLEYTFTGLEQNKTYSIKIVATNQKNGQVKECTKEITTAKQLVDEIKITPENATVQIGETLDLAVTISPEDAYNKAINWNSSNPEVATIDQRGKVTAVAEGTTTITATAQDGSNVQEICIFKVENGKTYLYRQGDKCETVTGGWVMDRNLYATSGGIINWNTTNLYLRGATTGNCGEYGVRTVNKIDYSKYSKIHVEVIGITLSDYYKVGRTGTNRKFLAKYK